jgi:tellurite methyltransferase
MRRDMKPRPAVPGRAIASGYSAAMSSPTPSAELRAQFGDIDIYLFDQLARGRFDARRRVLDAGCGGGRNLPYFLARGFEVFAIDEAPAAMASVAALAARLAPHLPPGHVRTGPVDQLPWPDASMDAVIASAVLHFARDRAHFDAMVAELWRVLAPGGLFFARLATSIGLESRLAAPVGRVRLPDGSDRFVVDLPTLLDLTSRLGGRLLDPIKTTNVQGERCMTTWVMEKNRQAEG